MRHLRPGLIMLLCAGVHVCDVAVAHAKLDCTDRAKFRKAYQTLRDSTNASTLKDIKEIEKAARQRVKEIGAPSKDLEAFIDQVETFTAHASALLALHAARDDAESLKKARQTVDDGQRWAAKLEPGDSKTAALKQRATGLLNACKASIARVEEAPKQRSTPDANQEKPRTGSKTPSEDTKPEEPEEVEDNTPPTPPPAVTPLAETTKPEPPRQKLFERFVPHVALVFGRSRVNRDDPETPHLSGWGVDVHVRVPFTVKSYEKLDVVLHLAPFYEAVFFQRGGSDAARPMPFIGHTTGTRLGLGVVWRNASLYAEPFLGLRLNRSQMDGVRNQAGFVGGGGIRLCLASERVCLAAHLSNEPYQFEGRIPLGFRISLSAGAPRRARE